MSIGEKTKKVVAAAGFLAESGLLAWLGVTLARRLRSDRSGHQLARGIIKAAEEERTRIARELHDDIGQRLSLISMQLSSVGRLHLGEMQDFQVDLADAQRELDSVIADVHDLSHMMHSATVTQLGLEESVRKLCRNIQRHHSLDIALSLEKLPEDLDPKVALCFYRVTQEALTNVIRHSESSRAAVQLKREGECLRMQIADQGIGFDASIAPGGLGLGTMEERAAAVGGKVLVVSRRGYGTVVSAEAPLRRVKQEERPAAN